MLWIAPRIQDLKGQLLREEGRSGTVVLVGADEPVGAELDLIIVEAEERRGRREVAIGVRSELVTRAVHVQFLCMRQRNRRKNCLTPNALPHK